MMHVVGEAQLALVRMLRVINSVLHAECKSKPNVMRHRMLGQRTPWLSSDGVVVVPPGQTIGCSPDDSAAVASCFEDGE